MICWYLRRLVRAYLLGYAEGRRLAFYRTEHLAEHEAALRASQDPGGDQPR